ncbi:family 1 glycosylhydrolase, partial [Klebsiella pneumoniae]|uniref:family 1 glycosylhydrolase n=1 Tax=Klebsiella pneumoniae TaxID=573 RepID=UPI002380E4CA
QPHTPLTDSEADIKATELADAIHTHWLYDPVLKGTYPADLLAPYFRRSQRVKRTFVNP